MTEREILKKNAGEFGVSLDDTALDRFELYARLLIKQNEVMNLTAVTDPRGITDKHFTDSLTLFKAVAPAGGSEVIDVGSGAGFPGVPMLIACPGIRLTLLDSTNKKCDFLEFLLRELGLTAEICRMRAEDAGKEPGYRERYDFAVSRAVAGMRELCEYCLPFVRQGGIFVAMKGSKGPGELEEAKTAVRRLGGAAEETIGLDLAGCGERNLLRIRKISQTPTDYPRSSAQIAKNPL